jgi:hypothetical protein
VRCRWKAAAGAVALAVAAALGGVSPAVSEAEPAPASKDFSKPAIVTSTTHQGRADGDFVDAGGNLLATVSYPDGNPSVNVAQFARDAISPFVNVG